MLNDQAGFVRIRQNQQQPSRGYPGQKKAGNLLPRRDCNGIAFGFIPVSPGVQGQEKNHHPDKKARCPNGVVGPIKREKTILVDIDDDAAADHRHAKPVQDQLSPRMLLPQQERDPNPPASQEKRKREREEVAAAP